MEDKIKLLIEDYKRKIIAADENLDSIKGSMYTADYIENFNRLNTKKNEYKSFIADLERALKSDTKSESWDDQSGFKSLEQANLYLRRQVVLMGNKLSEYIAKDISKSDELFMVWASRGGMGDFHAWPMAVFDSIEKAEAFKKEEDDKAAAIKKKCPCENKEKDAYWDYRAVNGHYLDNFQTDIQKCIINQRI